MNEIETIKRQLPDTLEDLTQFVLVGKAKLQAYMLKLQTVNKLSVAQEIRDQTLKETQEISNALIAAEQRIGELLLAIPKSSGQYAESENRPVSKNTIVSEMGYSKDEVSDYQRMAKNPEIVQRVIQDALANGEVVTKSQVLKEIKAERDKTKAEITDLKEERDYFKSQIEERDDKITELLKEVEKPAIDYEKQKKKALAALKADYEAEKEKVNKKQREILKLQDRIAELEGATKEGLENESLSENVYYFCMLANNFVGNVGGLVWLTERIGDMPSKEKELFLKAAHALEGFSLAFVQSLERSGHGENRRDGNDRRGEIPVITDQEEYGQN